MSGAEDFQDTHTPPADDQNDETKNTEGNKKNRKPRQPQPDGYSRKARSLGLLCKAFLGLYCQQSGLVVHVDLAARTLGVERRRIYDILNVLHGFQMMDKHLKSQYEWKGTAQLQGFLDKLLEEAQAEVTGPEIDTMDERKERSMSRLSQRFAQMFMLSQLKALELEEAAIALLGSSDESGQTKTKVRRLYDIANIMVSLGMIEKISSQETGKTWFRWLGVDGVTVQLASAGAEVAGGGEAAMGIATGMSSDPTSILAGMGIDTATAMGLAGAGQGQSQAQAQLQLAMQLHMPQLPMPMPLTADGTQMQPATGEPIQDLAQLMHMPLMFGFGVPNSALEPQAIAAAAAAAAAVAAGTPSVPGPDAPAYGASVAVPNAENDSKPAVGVKRTLPSSLEFTEAAEANGNVPFVGDPDVDTSAIQPKGEEAAGQHNKLHPLKRFVQLDNETAAKHPAGPAFFQGGSLWPASWPALGMYSHFWPGRLSSQLPAAVGDATGAISAAAGVSGPPPVGSLPGGLPSGTNVPPPNMSFPLSSLPQIPLPPGTGDGNGNSAAGGGTATEGHGAKDDEAPPEGTPTDAHMSSIETYAASVQAAYANWMASCASMYKDQSKGTDGKQTEEEGEPVKGPQ